MGGEYISQQNNSRGGEHTHACMPGCVIQCSNVYHDASGKEVVSPVEYETLGLLGTNCGIGDPDELAQLNYIANDLGVDTIETGAMLAVLMEAGLGAFGDVKFMADCLAEIRMGTENGRIWAQGTARVGEHYDVKRVPVIKKQAISAYDPRVVEATGITMMATAQGADHTAGNLPRLKTREMEAPRHRRAEPRPSGARGRQRLARPLHLRHERDQPEHRVPDQRDQRRARHEPHQGLLRGARAATRCASSTSSTGAPASRRRTTSCPRSSTRSRCRPPTTWRASTAPTCTACTSGCPPERARSRASRGRRKGVGGDTADPRRFSRLELGIERSGEMITVRFTYLTGLKRPHLQERPTRRELERLDRDADDGDHRRGRVPGLHGRRDVRRRAAPGSGTAGACALDGPAGANAWAITLEVSDPDSQERHRELHAARGGAARATSATTSPTAGASARRSSSRRARHGPGIRSSRSGRRTRSRSRSSSAAPTSGYIADDGTGIDPAQPVIPLQRARAASGRARRSRLRAVRGRCRTCSGSGTPRASGRTAPTSTRGGRSAAATSTRPEDGWDGDPEDARRHGQLQRRHRSGRRAPGVRADHGAAGARSPTRSSGPTSSRRAGPCPRGSRTWSSTSCTSARWASARRRRAPLRDAMELLDLPERPRRQRRRAAAGVRVLRRPELGLRRHAPLRHRVQRRRARQVQALRARVPPPRHRRHPGRRLQPLRQPTPSAPSGSTTRPRPSRTSTTGTRASPRLSAPRRRLPDNGSSGFDAAVLGGAGAAAVHQQRGRVRRGVPRRRPAGRPDPGHPPGQRAERERAAASGTPTCSGRSSCASGAARCG